MEKGKQQLRHHWEEDRAPLPGSGLSPPLDTDCLQQHGHRTGARTAPATEAARDLISWLAHGSRLGPNRPREGSLALRGPGSSRSWLVGGQAPCVRTQNRALSLLCARLVSRPRACQTSKWTRRVAYDQSGAKFGRAAQPSTVKLRYVQMPLTVLQISTRSWHDQRQRRERTGGETMRGHLCHARQGHGHGLICLGHYCIGRRRNAAVLGFGHQGASQDLLQTNKKHARDHLQGHA